MQRMQAHFSFKKTLLVSALSVFVSACSTQPTTALPVDNSWQPITRSERAERLSQLLTAEFTLQRQGSTKASQLYYDAAQATQDAAVAKRATTAAMISEDNQQVLQASEHWLTLEPDAAQAYPVRLQALLIAQQAEAAQQLLINATEQQVSLAFLPDFVDQNVRNNQVTATLFQALDTPKLNDNTYVQTAQFHLLFLKGRYQTIVDTIDPLLARVAKKEQEALLIIKAVSQDHMGHPKRAQKTLADALERFPNSERVLGNLLEIMVKNGYTKEAITAFHQADLSDAMRQQIGLALGQQLLMEGQAQQSAALLSDLPQQGGLHNQIQFFLANAQQQLGQYDQALRNLANVFGPLSWNATELLVEWFYQADQSDQVNPIILQRAAAEQEPGHIIGVSEIHEQNGRPDLALGLLNNALATFPELDSVRYKRAIFFDSQQQWQAAIKDLKILVDKHPEDAAYINALGYTMLVRQPDRFDTAFDWIKKAYTLEPEDPAILDSMGWGYYLQGDLQQAERFLAQSWQALDDAEIGAHYGEVLWQLDQQTQAIAIWQQALRNNAQLPALRDTVQQYAPQLLNTGKENS
ncbi:tetratricopeptide repeat protein [Marinomonas ostreistagni]|uniref:tetratricopeptide repeat protein n=1 Tax=Marinomonas ostreistagni TaxID=359209 RepID=UPI0019523A66|nr:tetratricopeptide repeat protein [Marinomonas ostreistagni]MBM6551603.1 tetratricopeptide repeat protein [Marinomonas ostreistagni]